MNPKTFTLIAATTAIAFGLAAFSLGRDSGFRPVAGTGDKVFPDLLAQVNDVTRLAIDGPNGTFTLTRGEGGWTMKESGGYAGRAVKLQRTILGLAQLRLVEAKTLKKENYSKLGLRDRATKGAQSSRVRLFDAKDLILADLLTGAARKSARGAASSGGVYVRRPGEARSWLASDNANDFAGEKRDWLERKIIDIKAKDVKSVVIRQAGAETVTLSKTSPEATAFTLENIPQGKKLISLASLSTVGAALADLLLDDVKNGAVQFDRTQTVTTDVTTFDGLSVRVLTAKKDGKFWITLNASGNDKAAAIMARTGGWIYRISNYAASKLTKKLDELLEDEKPKS